MINIETLIYIYIFVCLAVIVFNIVSVFSFQLSKQSYKKKEKWLEDIFIKELEQPNSHQKLIYKKIRDIDYMNIYTHILLSYDQSTREDYLSRSLDDICQLTRVYTHKEEIIQACFAYNIAELCLCDHGDNEIVQYMFKLVASSSSYCRENALNALYHTHQPHYIIKCLSILMDMNIYHYDKLIIDGILRFLGDRQQLGHELLKVYPEFSTEYKVIIINILKGIGNQFSSNIYQLYMLEKDQLEIIIAIIRYFARWKYDPIIDTLFNILKNKNSWELRAISAFALRNYPSRKVEKTLTALMSDKNWYVRYNAAESLMIITNIHSIQNEEVSDRYGQDILQYMRQKSLLKDGDIS